MARGVRVKEGEDFSKGAIERVIELLEGSPPITKKDACAMLGMAYNTARLNKIIEQHKDNEERIKKRKQAIKNTPVTKEEKALIISSYLEGDSMDSICDATFRSLGVVKNVIDSYHIPKREKSENYKSIVLPEESIQEDYEKNDLVFSAKYNCVAKIQDRNKSQPDVYCIWLYDGDHQQYAYQPFWELGSLVNVQRELGVDITDYTVDEINSLIREALIKARKFKNAEK